VETLSYACEGKGQTRGKEEYSPRSKGKEVGRDTYIESARQETLLSKYRKAGATLSTSPVKGSM
jgi:hypothetical protein